VSSAQYFNYLASNFGIVKTANAADFQFKNCTTLSGNTTGYGFCGLQPIFLLWATFRDMAYALLTLAFIFLALGVMLRFRIDPRTVMTLQNQIPRVIISILLITFSYAIVGVLIDIMWTVTYTGINVITNSSKAQVAYDCSGDDDVGPLGEKASFRLLDNPVSFANTIFLSDCKGIDNGGINSGIFELASNVNSAFGALVKNIIANLFFGNETPDCGLTNPFDCFEEAVLWIIGLIVQIIIIVALLIALFRLWFVLIKTYISLLIFIILGPVYIVFGLIPGRPMGFEKWIRLIFAHLAAFPLVAFILVLGRVLTDAIPINPPPESVFIPPLVGNPNAGAFSVLMGFGAVLLAPSIPGLIREKMKAPEGKTGSAISGGIVAGVGVATSPGAKAVKHLNRTDHRG
ncbi:MAG: hypothetical protein ACRD4B_04990, partial [Acidobacteriota bacterium]